MAIMIESLSSNIASYGYNPINKNLAIKFKSSGKIYVYKDVERSTFSELGSASSQGQYHNQNIKDNFSYIEINESDLDDYIGLGEPKFVMDYSNFASNTTDVWF